MFLGLFLGLGQVNQALGAASPNRSINLTGVGATASAGIVTEAVDAAQTVAFLARTSGLTGTETSAYKALINGIVADGDFASLTGLYILATNTTTTAALNLIANSNNLTTHGTPTSFVADTGYTGDGSTFYLDSGYVPNTSGAITSMGVYKPNSRIAAHSWADIGCSTSASAYSYLGNFPAVNFEMGGDTFPTAANTDAQGAWAALRVGSNVSVYKNNVSAAFTTASDALTGSPAASLTIFAFKDTVSGPSDISGDLISAAWFGNLTAAGIIRVHNRINAYLATVNPGLNLWIDAPSPAITLTLPPFMYNSGYPTKYIGSDTWASTWADDGNIYTSNDDTITGSWQAVPPSSNMMISLLSGFTTSLTGSTVNSMTAFGAENTTGSDGRTYKIYGLISVNGVLYASTSRQAATANGAGQYTSINGQIIKSSDHGATWTPLPPSTANPYASPMFSSAGPVWVQYGQDYQGNTIDNSNLYVYSTITDVGWNNNNSIYLARVLISAIGNLSASDWSYYKGNSSGDITNSANWDSSFSNAVAILTSTKKLGVTGVQYANGKYIMMQWYYPSIANGNAIDETSTVWTLYESASLRGPWIAKQTIFWPLTGLYDARVIPKSVSGSTLTFATTGNFGDQNAQTGQYTLQLVPATVS